MKTNMKRWATSFRAIHNVTGELVEFSGPAIWARTWDEAIRWCEENAGHLIVEGELVAEIPYYYEN